jgi:NitT/TauT family transport system ATP-binding protein
MLAARAFIGRPAEWMLHGLSGRLDIGGGEARQAEDFFVPFAKAATFPWKSHALWFYSQMVRWGQVAHTAENASIARETYRPDLYRSALKPLGVALPSANAKVEGALVAPTPVGSAGASLTLGPDGFFDGALFDPDRLDAYIDAQRR